MNPSVDVGFRLATGRYLHLVSHDDFWITVCCKCGITVSIKNAKYLMNYDFYTHIIAIRKAILIPALFVGTKRHFADIAILPINFHLANAVIWALRHDYAPDHLAAAALHATALRSSSVSDTFRTQAPAWPILTLAGTSRGCSSISPLAILVTRTGHPTTSAVRRSRSGPLGTASAVRA